MRIISLNVWGGKVFEPLMRFIEEEALRTDIFCFQEMIFGTEPAEDVKGSRANLSAEIAQRLSAFREVPFIVPGASFSELPSRYGSGIGLSIFLKKEMDVLTHEESTIYPEYYALAEKGEVTGRAQWVRFARASREYWLGNLHGIWQRDKGDTPERLEQFRRLGEKLESFGNVPRILIGDFNARPAIVALRELENAGMRNLVKEYAIARTRTDLYLDEKKYSDFIADYAFVSPEITVRSCAAFPEVQVSDHAPLVLEIE